MENSIFGWLDERGIPYHDKELINQACIHSSYLNEHRQYAGDNERLEFLGDSVLQLYATTFLYERDNPALSEGEMTRLRSQLVREEALASYSRQLGWNHYILLGVGEEKSGGRNRDSILADMFEALLGAIYIDCGYDAAGKILGDVLVKQYEYHRDELVIDYKTKLQEYIQADKRSPAIYKVLETSGPSNDPTFKVAVIIDGITYGEGVGHSKKKAAQAAAKDAFDKMVK